MTQKDKQLLLKDLCARVPYGVRYRRFAWDDKQGEECISAKIYSISPDGYVRNYHEDGSDYIDNVRPYLFPFSSMTEEQKMFLKQQNWCIAISTSGTVETTIKGIDWLNKNHFDYRGLIERGLAIDANNLNIY